MGQELAFSRSRPIRRARGTIGDRLRNDAVLPRIESLSDKLCRSSCLTSTETGNVTKFISNGRVLSLRRLQGARPGPNKKARASLLRSGLGVA